MKKPASTHDKPAMDEGSFQQLLSAAFVLQQHNERAQAGKPEYGYARTLAGILEIQEQVRSQRLDFQATASLVARRIRELTQAVGAAVGILDGDQLEYYAASGSAAGEAGARAAIDSTLAADCLRSGLVLQCQQAEIDPRLSRELCRQLGVKALIAVPMTLHGRVGGVLELHFDQPGSFAEHDIRTCQLLAALLAETASNNPARTVHSPENASPAAPETTPPPIDERASLLATLERLKPHLERLAGESTPAPSAAVTPGPQRRSVPDRPSSLPAGMTSDEDKVCEACGHQLTEDELFCVSCGVARRSPNPWTSLWEMQRAAEKSSRGPSPQSAMADDVANNLDVLPSEVEDIVARLARESSGVEPNRPVQTPHLQVAPAATSASDAEAPPLAWTFRSPEDSHSEERAELSSFGVARTQVEIEDQEIAYASDEALRPSGTIDLNASSDDSAARGTVQLGSSGWLVGVWRHQRANIYVGLSALLLVGAIAGWGTPDAPPPQNNNAAAAHAARVPPKPELSFFDQLLVDVGLAEAPQAPTDPGNPKARVWIDVHTALYYCAGADLYGKTPGGRFTDQQDAQQDQFQPAARRPCD